MLRVGLTGGTSSGKSTVANILRRLGAHVSESDEIGRAMMQPGEPVYDRIVQHFGAEVVQADGALDRRVLARIAFEDGRVEELNSIVHPAVIAAQAAWMSSVERAQPEAVAVVETALLFETRHGAAGEAGGTTGTPWRTRFDRIVLVTAPEDVRLQRYLCRAAAFDHAEELARARRDAQARFAVQRSDEEKAAMSDYVLRNDGTVKDLEAEVERVYRTLLTESGDRLASSM